MLHRFILVDSEMTAGCFWETGQPRSDMNSQVANEDRIKPHENSRCEQEPTIQWSNLKRTHGSPLTGFWCKESTKLRGFSMLYLRSRIVCAPPPSDHKPFLEAFAWSSKSHSLACSGLTHKTHTKHIH